MTDPGSPFAPGEQLPTSPYYPVPQWQPPDSGEPIVAELADPYGYVKKPHPHIGWAILWMFVPIAAQFAAAIVLVIVMMIYFAATSVPRAEWQSKFQDLGAVLLPAVTLSTLLSSLAAAAIVFRRDLARKLALRNCSLVQWVLVALLVAPLAVIGGEVGNWATEVLVALDLRSWAEFGQQDFIDFSKQAWLLVFISACVLPGLGEEVFFRGFLSRGLVANHGVIWGSLLASMLFAALHLAPVQVCATFVLGLGMQYIFLTTRSLWAPILYHVLNNSLAFVSMRHGEEIGIEGVTEPEVAVGQHTAWPLLIASIFASAAILLALYQCRTRWLLPKGNEWTPGFFATEKPPAALQAQAVTRWPSVVAILALIVSFGLFVGAIFLEAS